MPPPIILIPARMASTRLPGKPLADIAGLPMIVQVWRRAMESGAGRVVVACDSEAIAQVIREAGGEAILTDPALPSGSDRIHAALQDIDPLGQHGIVVNLQGDLPTLDPHLVRDVVAVLDDPLYDMATLAAVITQEHEKTDPSVVKVVFNIEGGEHEHSYDSPSAYSLVQSPPLRSPSKGSLCSHRPLPGRALYFSRAAIPSGDGPLYHHIGIYAYRRGALDLFVTLPQGVLEQREKLEQLRALEHGIAIGVRVVDTVPFGVDTPEQLEQAQWLMKESQ